MTDTVSSAAANLYDRIRSIDPARRRDDVELSVYTDGIELHLEPSRCQPRRGSGRRAGTFGMRRCTLAELDDLMVCQHCSADVALEQYLRDMLDDEALAEAIWVVERYDALAAGDPADQVCVRLAETAITTIDVITAGDRFARLVTTVFRDIDDTLVAHTDHDQALRAAIDRVVERLDAIHNRAVTGARPRALLAAAVKISNAAEGRPFDTHLVHVALAAPSPTAYLPTEISDDIDDVLNHSGFGLALRRAYSSRRSSDRDDVLCVPRWVAEHLQRCNANAVLSAIYEELDPVVLDTARHLWQPGTSELYANFDACVAAARTLQR